MSSSSTESELDREISLNDLSFNRGLLQGSTENIMGSIECSGCNSLLISCYSCKECPKSYCGKCFTCFNFCKFCGCCEELKHWGLNFVLRQDFKIKCPSESECQTLCHVTELEEHINECVFIEMSKCNGCGYKDIKPQVDNHRKQCQYVTVECEYCNNKYKRNEVENHLTDCELRPITCEYCDESYPFANSQYHSSSKCFKKMKDKIHNNFQSELNELNEKFNTKYDAINVRLETINTDLELLKEENKSLKECVNLLKRKRRFADNLLSCVFQNTNLVNPNPIIINDQCNEIYCLLKIVANNKFLVASAGATNVLKIWDILGKTCLIQDNEHNKYINSLIQLRSSDTDIILLSCGNDGKIVKYNIGEGDELKSKELIYQASEEIYTLAELSDNYIAWAGSDQSVHIKNFTASDADDYILKDHTDTVYSIVVIKIDNCELIASGSKDRTIKLWNFYKGKPINTLIGHNNTVNHLSIIDKNSPPILMSSSFDKTTRLWDIGSGECISVFNEHKNFVYSSLYLSIHEVILTCSADKTVKVWNSSGDKCLQTLGVDRRLTCLTAFENIDRFFIMAAGAHEIYIWTSLCDEMNNDYNINFID
jgi:WD40 repeat protein